MHRIESRKELQNKYSVKDQKYTWKKEYSFVLIANVIYIIAFYVVTNYFNV
jgi:hypothetical protein